jgi:GTP-binding protein Era
MVLVDLPGVQRPRDVLTERMQRRVERELADSDAVVFVVNAEQGVGPGDRFIARQLLAARGGTSRAAGVPVICAVNKLDRVRPPEAAKVLSDSDELGVADEIFPISAKRGTGLGPFTERVAELLPEGPFLYPPESHSDQPSDVHLAELIREQVLRRTRDEIPHAVEVAVQSIEEREDGLVAVTAQIWVESDSQKGILIGRGGRMIKEIGSAARRELERDLGDPVFLDLQVRLRERWRRDESLLDRLGID